MKRVRNAPRLDATNIAGITTLMNKQHIKNDINLQMVEDTIMKKDKNEDFLDDNNDKKEYDPVEFYSSEIVKLAEELGVDLITTEDIIDTKKSEPNIDSNHVTFNKYDKDEELIIENKSNSNNSSIASSPKNSIRSQTTKYSKNSLARSDRSDKSDKSDKSHKSKRKINIDKFISSLDETVGVNLSSDKFKNKYVIPDIKVGCGKKKENNIDRIVNTMYDEVTTGYTKENEKIEDEKISKIEQISQLRMTLEEEGISCEKIEQPNINSSIDQINSTLDILRLKNDRNRYSTLAEEIILGFAEGIETVFDGNRKIPLFNWKPDYRGYHSTVNIKLHRMRFETSQVVGSLIEKHNINPITRIIMELLPSFFLYPRQQSKQKNTPGLYSDPNINDSSIAYASITESEKRKKEDILDL